MTSSLRDLTGDYVLDPARTRIGFVARHTVGPAVRGWFDRFAGSGRLDGDDLSRSSVELTVQAGSVQTRNPQRDRYLRGKYLKDADHPVITFTSSRVERTGETAFQVTGDLSIRGVSNPITLELELAGDGDGRPLRLRGGVTIDRTDWGVKWNAAAGLVARKVALELDLAAVRRP
ncbi:MULTISPECIES: YceI family protein [unclassified Nonomuraea]|uniref:YceI family protein n=1 Tax=unclassified Nonomuraea TaxID=2593643 RepID=UPI0033CDB6AC